MHPSVRLFLGSGQQCDLHVEEIPDAHCRLKVEAHPGAHDGLVVEFSIDGRCADVHGEQEADNPIVSAPAHESIGEYDRSGRPVVDEACASIPFRNGHFNSLQFSPQAMRNFVEMIMNGRKVRVES